MNKKGMSVLLLLGEVIIVAVVMALIINHAENMAKSDSVIKINTANNFMLMVNTLVGTPGDGLVAFPYNVSQFTLILSSNSVTVFKVGESQSEYTIRNFNLPEGYTAEGVIKEKSNICLEKKNKKILLREC